MQGTHKKLPTVVGYTAVTKVKSTIPLHYWIPTISMLGKLYERVRLGGERQRNASLYLEKDLSPNNFSTVVGVGAPASVHIKSPGQCLKTQSNDSIATVEITNVNTKVENVNCLEQQMGTSSDVSLMRYSGDSQQQNVMFSQQLPEYRYSVDSVADPTRRLQDANDATLENFFSRPLKIHEEEWGTGAALAFDIDPWSLYFENPRVSNRIANFSLLRATLNIRIVINGNGFQYGRAMASYLPLDAFDDLSSNAALVPQDLVQASQQPKIFLNPTTSTGGDMVLPFFYHRNYLRIASSEWSNMGRLYVRSINDLKHANGATDVVTVSVFAWATDVSMSVLTSVEPSTLTPQMGEIEEANTKGMISGPATAIAKAATAMSAIPAIRPFAMATEVIANASAAVAKHFGYCRPPVTKDPEPFKPTPLSSLALTNVPDTIQKLTIDNKQELTIDPRIAGLGSVDTMNIKEIAKRESYLTTFNWAIGTAPETLLWNSHISPVTWAESTVGLDTSYHLPACAFAALPFDFWTGTMKFRFQIVASAFHKGRIKVVYDPAFIASNEYNTNYLDIIDIADKTDFTIEIGNGQSDTLLRHLVPGIDSYTEVYSTTAYAAETVGNGVIGVYVVNELTTPNSVANNDIQINVYVSMGDDFEVFVPNDNISYYTYKPTLEAQMGILETQAGELVPESQNTEEPDAPQQEQTLDMGPGYQDNTDINKVFTGEAISSFRTLLKRYNLFRAIGLYDTSYTLSYIRWCMFPFLRGFVTGAVDQTAALNDYNYCNTVMLHWIVNAHQGWRGSVRWKALHLGTNNTSVASTVFVERRGKYGSTGYLEGTTNGYAAVNQKEAARDVVVSFPAGVSTTAPPHGGNGIMYQTSAINPTVEFEMPFYSNYRFLPGKREDYTTLPPLEAFEFSWNSTGSTASLYEFYCAAGEDFQCYFWTGCPRIYYSVGPPA